MTEKKINRSGGGGGAEGRRASHSEPLENKDFFLASATVGTGECNSLSALGNAYDVGQTGGMNFQAIVKSVSAQFAIIGAAPIPFIVVLSFATLAVWQISRWYYAGQIEALTGRITFRDDEIARLKERLSTSKSNKVASMSDGNGREVSPVDDEKGRKRRTLQTLETALQDAQMELTFARGAFSNRNVPAMKAAILSANKVFGIVEPYPTPANEGGPLTLTAGVLLLRHIVPLLREGHEDEARKVSQELHNDEARRAELREAKRGD